MHTLTPAPIQEAVSLGRVVTGAGDNVRNGRLDARLRQAQKMEAVGCLAGGIAHDFNNLLTAILGYADLVLEEIDPADRHRPAIAEIARAGQAAARLTRQLLAFSRRSVLEPEVLDLARIIAGVEPMLHRTLGEHIRLEIAVQEGLASIKADAGQIEQVIVNLAINARDAMPAGGRLRIEAGYVSIAGDALMPGGDYVRITVSDTGHGIAPDVQPHIFEPFFTTKGSAGTGLGLATVYGIVKQSGGFVWVDSQVACGTTFRVELPACRETAVPAADPAPAKTPAAAIGTILLVEDEITVRDLVSRCCKRRGYLVLTAGDAAEALALAADYPGTIDLLLTDVVMPDKSGPMLGRELRQTRRGTRVLLMSGYPRTTDRDVADGFLRKPFTLAELLDAVDGTMHGQA